jgi:hypothetical protein
MIACGRKEKQANKIGENHSQEKRKKEKTPVRRKNSIEQKDKSQDKPNWIVRLAAKSVRWLKPQFL